MGLILASNDPQPPADVREWKQRNRSEGITAARIVLDSLASPREFALYWTSSGRWCLEEPPTGGLVAVTVLMPLRALDTLLHERDAESLVSGMKEGRIRIEGGFTGGLALDAFVGVLTGSSVTEVVRFDENGFDDFAGSYQNLQSALLKQLEQEAVGVQVSVTTAMGLDEFAVGSAGCEPMSVDHLSAVYSTMKPVRALVTLDALIRRGLTPDTRLGEVLSLSCSGLRNLTVTDVLTHYTGVAPDPFESRAFADSDTLFLDADDYPPTISSDSPHYSTVWCWVILEQVVSVVTGLSFTEYSEQALRRNVPNTSGLSLGTIAPPGVPIATGVNTLHEPRRSVIFPTLAYAEEEAPAERPPTAGLASASGLSRFYSSVLKSVERRPKDMRCMLGVRLKPPAADQRFRREMSYGYGTMLETSKSDPLFGSACADSTFGHIGGQNSVAFCDPANGLAIAIVFVGLQAAQRHSRRCRYLVDSIYKDLRIDD